MRPLTEKVSTSTPWTVARQLAEITFRKKKKKKKEKKRRKRSRLTLASLKHWPEHLLGQEAKAVFEKLFKFVGKDVEAFLRKKEKESYCFRLQKNKIYYIRESIMRKSTNVRSFVAPFPTLHFIQHRLYWYDFVFSLDIERQTYFARDANRQIYTLGKISPHHHFPGPHCWVCEEQGG